MHVGRVSAHCKYFNSFVVHDSWLSEPALCTVGELWMLLNNLKRLPKIIHELLACTRCEACMSMHARIDSFLMGSLTVVLELSLQHEWLLDRLRRNAVVPNAPYLAVAC